MPLVVPTGAAGLFPGAAFPGGAFPGAASAAALKAAAKAGECWGRSGAGQVSPGAGGCGQEPMLSLGCPVTRRDPGTGESARPEPPGAETAELPGPCAQYGDPPLGLPQGVPFAPKGHPELVPSRPALARRRHLPWYTPLPDAPRCWHWRRGWNWSWWPRGPHR